MGLAILSTLEKGTGPTTLEFKISLVRPITLEFGNDAFCIKLRVDRVTCACMSQLKIEVIGRRQSGTECAADQSAPEWRGTSSARKSRRRSSSKLF